jgi:replication factor C subunit 2/4
VGEVVCQEEVVGTLTRAIETANLPNLLFYGPPGTGKTSAAMAMAMQLYGPELSKFSVMELNASEDRGISVVRDKVKSFSKEMVSTPTSGYPCPPYKLMILDEADSMTQDAQNAMRRTMETFSRVTRFCFICNNVNRIIVPIASRCAKFRFRPVQDSAVERRVSEICRAEGVEMGEGVVTALNLVSSGDLRRAITTLQSAVRLRGRSVAASTVLEVAGVVPSHVISGILDSCKKGVFEDVKRAVDGAIYAGYSSQQVLLQMQTTIVSDETMDDLTKASLYEAIAETDCHLSEGGDEALHLLNTFYSS